MISTASADPDESPAPDTFIISLPLAVCQLQLFDDEDLRFLQKLAYFGCTGAGEKHGLPSQFELFYFVILTFCLTAGMQAVFVYKEGGAHLMPSPFFNNRFD